MDNGAKTFGAKTSGSKLFWRQNISASKRRRQNFSAITVQSPLKHRTQAQCFPILLSYVGSGASLLTKLHCSNNFSMEAKNFLIKIL